MGGRQVQYLGTMKPIVSGFHGIQEAVSEEPCRILEKEIL